MTIFRINMNEDQKNIITQTANYVQSISEKDSSGHDWWHIYRVYNLALKISELEGGEKFVIELSALLHDLDDWKLNGGEETGKAESWLEKVGVKNEERTRILRVIGEVSFKGAGVETRTTTIEAKIVQDADRLDAIGAIGIARTFAYGGNKNRIIYDPGIKPVRHNSFDAYKNNTAPTINHFYEKLLLLKNRLNTKTARKIAQNRHEFMEKFLLQFFSEWDNIF
ncbi:HD domain-containing protein [Maribellus maritimus]|uniref:HD domain-containing protein n=1 Tax=Maribellus maritimus TaxID=2870838 RepID=UPI001EEC2448|nr:HD domain-containing protein [Maribellus maritimus]MCG6189036.1 HD domain-containing protein [Maribellus maritimus]